MILCVGELTNARLTALALVGLNCIKKQNMRFFTVSLAVGANLSLYFWALVNNSGF